MNAFSGFGPAIAAGKSGHGAVSMAVASGRVQLVTIRQQSLTLARWRVLWVVLAFAFIAMLALVRIAYLGMSDEGLRGTSLEEALLPPRGEITDRNGIPLARAFPAYALWFNPEAIGEGGTPLVREPAVVAAKLKAIFPDLNEKAVAAQFAAGKQGYIRRRVLPEEANRVQEIGELALEMPTETDRHYPQGSMRLTSSAMLPPTATGAWGWNRSSTNICPIRLRAARPSPCRSIPVFRAHSKMNCAAG